MKINWFWIIFCLCCFVFGIILGMNIGITMLIEKVTYNLGGSTFIINFNETRMIEELNKTIVPQMINRLGEKT